ncbi:hypothetical protein [Shouchella miscanthi]|uniref:hypothetical protein n=1 Tax=Shouchella miscanthi TaxID=2598861 RepID=UPI0011A72672|nr:hypothetical protein [Shouchella miscanthi]
MSGINDQVGPRLYQTLEDITGLHKESKEARERSQKAEDKAASADWKSEITQKRLFEAVDGQEQLDETKMIRVDVEDGKVYPNASAKLDAVQQRTTAQLAQKANLESPINPNWSNWDDIRWNYGFDRNKTRIHNTFKGVLETDAMISVRGGGGRWNSVDGIGSFINGGHVFEGWSADEKYRFTMLVGKREMEAHIQVFNPITKEMGVVKLGTDRDNLGYDFSERTAKFFGEVAFENFQAIRKTNNAGSLDFTGGSKFGAGNRDGASIKMFGGSYLANPGGMDIYLGDYARDLTSFLNIHHMKNGKDVELARLFPSGRFRIGGALIVGKYDTVPPVLEKGTIFYGQSTDNLKVASESGFTDIISGIIKDNEWEISYGKRFETDRRGAALKLFGDNAHYPASTHIHIGSYQRDLRVDSHFAVRAANSNGSAPEVMRIDGLGKTWFFGSVKLGELTSDPTPENGRMYYNSSTRKIRICEGLTWKNMIA